MMMYRTHCQRILDTAIRANFSVNLNFMCIYRWPRSWWLDTAIIANFSVNLYFMCIYRWPRSWWLDTVIRANFSVNLYFMCIYRWPRSWWCIGHTASGYWIPWSEQTSLLICTLCVFTGDHVHDDVPDTLSAISLDTVIRANFSVNLYFMCIYRWRRSWWCIGHTVSGYWIPWSEQTSLLICS